MRLYGPLFRGGHRVLGPIDGPSQDGSNELIDGSINLVEFPEFDDGGGPPEILAFYAQLAVGVAPKFPVGSGAHPTAVI